MLAYFNQCKLKYLHTYIFMLTRLVYNSKFTQNRHQFDAEENLRMAEKPWKLNLKNLPITVINLLVTFILLFDNLPVTFILLCLITSVGIVQEMPPQWVFKFITSFRFLFYGLYHNCLNIARIHSNIHVLKYIMNIYIYIHG